MFHLAFGGLALLGIIAFPGYVGYKLCKIRGLAIGMLIGFVIYVQICEMLRAHYNRPQTDKSSAFMYLAFLWPYMTIIRQNNI